MATSRPRMEAGATSAMYIGERFDAIPIATPPRIRQTTNQSSVVAHPVRMDDMAKIKAEISSRILRPNLSLSIPDTSDPIRQPTSAQLLAQPLSVSFTSMPGTPSTSLSLAIPKKGWKNGFAPPITTQS
jgi:hypothetical protein